MRLAILIASRNRPDLVDQLVDYLERNVQVEHDVIVVEAGTDPDKLSRHSTLRYDDPDFRGKCFAHNVALERARKQAAERGGYDYYWVLMNDLVFAEGTDPAATLIETLEANPQLGILSPTCEDGAYPGSARRPGGDWRPVTTCDYLGFMMPARAVEQVGFLNPAFQYCWGAIHELAYQLYSAGWFVAYSDRVTYRHLGGTTYGAEGTNTIPRDEYQRRAARFAWSYFQQHYGPDWPRAFYATASRTQRIEVDTFSDHERYWRQVMQTQPAPALPTPNPQTPEAKPAMKLHLGCGRDKRLGWTNVDVNPDLNPDVVSSATDLGAFADNSAEAIESCHLFEHLTLDGAREALQEWRRVLAPGGELHLELPNLQRSIELIGTQMDGYDLGMISLFGYPPEIATEGVPQLHKWGWTPETLRAELLSAGFMDVEEVPITQTHRKAAKYNRDMRLVARKPVEVVLGEAPSGPSPAASAIFNAAGMATAAAASPVPQPQPAPTPKPPGFHVFAWPTYQAEALVPFLETFGRHLAGREDVVLHLRLDPAVDGEAQQAIEALQQAHAQVLGAETLLNVRLVDGELDEAGWRDLGRQMDLRLRVGSERLAREGARLMPTPIVDEPAALASHLRQAGLAPLDPATKLQQRIAELHPWFYPVQVGPHRVQPGVGSVCAPQWLENRARCRASLLQHAVLERVDFQGRSLLDLACNCALWSSHYARAGATRLLGVEGRSEHVQQAELYWEQGGFLPRDAYRFEQGNVADASAWETIRAVGPFDVTLCAGILYHVPNYREILTWAAEQTREVLIVDTRVTEEPEAVVREPGDLRFNAIEATLDKVVPNRTQLLQHLWSLGFETEVLPVPFETQLGVSDVDDYAGGARVTVVARKVTADLEVAPALPASNGLRVKRPDGALL